MGVPPAEPAVLELYPQGPEWEKEAEANAVFLGGLAAIDVVVDRVRCVLRWRWRVSACHSHGLSLPTP